MATPRAASTETSNRQGGWAAQMQEYEREKRYHIDPALLKGPTVGFAKGVIATKERAYNPLLGRFLDEKREVENRHLQKEVEMGHLNRARDIQLRREAAFDLVTHEKKFEAIQSSNDFMPPGGVKGSSRSYPDSTVDFNIVSNLPFDQHHPAHPAQRPAVAHRVPKKRQVPAMLYKDFNILTNRYIYDHEGKTERDRQLELLDAADKHRNVNFFHPIKQKFCDDRMEQRVTACEDAYTTEVKLRGEEAQPLTHRGSVTASYDMVTHEVKDPELMHYIVAAEEGRNERYKTRHAFEDKTRMESRKQEDAAIQATIAKTSHERFEETARRGFDIITGQQFGNGRKDKQLHTPRTKPKDTALQQVFKKTKSPDQRLQTEVGQARALARDNNGQAAEATWKPGDVATLRFQDSMASGLHSARIGESTGRRAMTPRNEPRSARLPAPPAPPVPGSPGGSIYS
eukprot:CAMPEP_0197653928 /NCGR_PEP_ID=MMETSP1338-20131121/37767_1 /TAXON_ID=43686 ORGANISM="Pelagodinium beii, Strain RCC1491" /NCGR_SAMPLE_ID=MMETSP1338 /ASSEMBLY_ACC=CAM_ASM_000754 /LENGTH=456 /DNA_ID=CAMNT_0043229229 /DNA_START=87 /DNA_END=1453 /DNA_ORIENTATION=+